MFWPLNKKVKGKETFCMRGLDGTSRKWERDAFENFKGRTIQAESHFPKRKVIKNGSRMFFSNDEELVELEYLVKGFIK